MTPEEQAKCVADFSVIADKYMGLPQPADPTERAVWLAVYHALAPRIEKRAEGLNKLGRHWYRAVKNYLLNTRGVISNEALKGLVREAVKEQVADQFGRYTKTAEFATLVAKLLRSQAHVLQQAAAQEITKNLRLTLVEPK